MNLVFIAVAFASMADKCSCVIGIRAIHGARCCAEHTTARDGGSADFAGSKNLPGTYLRRATAVNTEFMSGAVVVGCKHLLRTASNNLIDELMGQQ